MSFAPENQPFAKPEALLRVPVGLASPLWGLFAGAAVTGATWWWMTRWARPQNLEAMFAAAEIFEAEVDTTPMLAAPAVEVAAEPLAEVAAAALVEVPPQSAAETEGPAAVDPTVEVIPEPVAMEARAAPPQAVEPTVVAGGAKDLAGATAEAPKPKKKPGPKAG